MRNGISVLLYLCLSMNEIECFSDALYMCVCIYACIHMHVYVFKHMYIHIYNCSHLFLISLLGNGSNLVKKDEIRFIYTSYTHTNKL